MNICAKCGGPLEWEGCMKPIGDWCLSCADDAILGGFGQPHVDRANREHGARAFVKWVLRLVGGLPIDE